MRANRSVLAQRAIVLQILRDDHPARWTRAELERALRPGVVGDALAKLEAEEVAVVDGEQVRASRCARHLDALGLIVV